MKKIILIISILFLTGCYDYIEINDISFINTIALDYENNKYNITFEILNDSKSSENSNEKSYLISSSGETISKAFDNISLKIAKIPYYYHLKAIVIDENIANNLYELIDFIARNKEIRNEFYLVIAKDNKASEILNSENNENDTIGDKISQMLKTSKNDYNISYDFSFEDTLEKILNNNIDAQITYLKLDNKEIKTGGISIIKNYKIKYYLSEEDSGRLNALLNKENSLLLTKYYDNNPVSIKVYNSKVNYVFTNKKIIIKITAEGEIIQNTANIDLYKKEEYQKLNNNYSKLLKKEINLLINTLKENNIDPLGLKDKYYKKTKKEISNIYDNFEIITKISLEVNKKGLIFEVKK